MADFFDAYARTELEELSRIYDAGPEGLKQREISPKFFAGLQQHGFVEKFGPEHYKVSRRGRIQLERAHMLNA